MNKLDTVSHHSTVSMNSFWNAQYVRHSYYNMYDSSYLQPIICPVNYVYITQGYRPAVCCERADWCQWCALWENELGSGQVLIWVSQGHFLKSIHTSILSYPGVDVFPLHIILADALHDCLHRESSQKELRVHVSNLRNTASGCFKNNFAAMHYKLHFICISCEQHLIM